MVFSGSKILRLVLLILVLMTGAAQPVLSQEDSAARAVVQQAMDNLAEGYQYTLDWQTAQHFSGEDDEFNIYNRQSITGEVTANGDYAISVAAYAGESAEFVADMPPLEMQQIQLDGELYINLPNIDTDYAGFFDGLESGWQSYDEMHALFDDSTAQRLAFEGLTDIRLPAEFPLTEDMILSVVEQDAETIDDVEMRVFVVEVDALEIMLRQTPGTPLERMRLMLESADFFKKSELSLRYTLWIGAADGQLYRGESVGSTFLPYLTEEEQGVPYDLTIESSAAFTIAQHGAVDAIRLPDEIAATD